jgi:putative addiction module component (TIGR02574 family)
VGRPLIYLELIEQIWDSLPPQVNPDEVPEWHRAELVRRRAEADTAPNVGKPWREALARGPISNPEETDL